MHKKEFFLETQSKDEMINLDGYISKIISEHNLQNAKLHIFVPHTTAGITINENADPDVKHDILCGLHKVFPKFKEFHHFEDNSAAHIKSTLVGVQETIFILNSKPQLGQWQSLYFCEFDGPRTRSIFFFWE